jgi:polar amino acid transport system substrate-binding protein
MFRLSGILAALALTTSFALAQSPPLHELAPTGKLRVGIAIAPTGSAFWATRDAASGKPRGVTIDLGAALAQKLGVPVEYVVFANSGEIVTAANDGKWDVTFVPVDDARKKVVDFGPAYQMFERAFLVRPGSPIQTIAEVDQPGVHVIGVENTTTARSAAAFLKNTKVETVKTVEELQALIGTGKADAVALSRESLAGFAAAVPGSRVLPGAYSTASTAIAVPKGHGAALTYVTAFIEEVKASGLVRRALDDAGLTDSLIAPPQATIGIRG